MIEEINNFNIKNFPIGEPVVEEISLPSFYGMQKVKAPVYVYRATKKISPCIVITSCMHGDEINGLRISQAVMKSKIKLEKGTLIIIPILNIYGFLNKARYLPDRKDLNRFFPGKKSGSFGSRFAKLIMDNFGSVGDFYIDLHSGGLGRHNIPQIRCDFKAQKMNKILRHIEIPLVVNSFFKEGSFREALSKKGKQCIVFEGGEGLRLDESVTAYGLNMVKSILIYFKMIKPNKKYKQLKQKFLIHKTKWIRANSGGVLVNKFTSGKVVKAGQVIAEMRTNTGNLIYKIRAEADGVILGASKASLIMAGDALFNIGYIGKNQPFEEDVLDFDEI